MSNVALYIPLAELMPPEIDLVDRIDLAFPKEEKEQGESIFSDENLYIVERENWYSRLKYIYFCQSPDLLVSFATTNFR